MIYNFMKKFAKIFENTIPKQEEINKVAYFFMGGTEEFKNWVKDFFKLEKE